LRRRQKRVYLSEQAEADLAEAWLYVARDNRKAADRLLTQLRQKCLLLANSPEMGRKRDELRPSIRSFPHGNYVIFYRIAVEGVEVVRVLSSYRDIEAIFHSD